MLFRETYSPPLKEGWLGSAQMTAIYAAAFFCGVLIGLNILSIGIAMARARPPRGPVPAPEGAPAVSIVRPVCGLDNFCEETLGSSFSLDYPAYRGNFLRRPRA